MENAVRDIYIYIYSYWFTDMKSVLK
jgi:hypothetical protein